MCCRIILWVCVENFGYNRFHLSIPLRGNGVDRNNVQDAVLPQNLSQHGVQLLAYALPVLRRLVDYSQGETIQFILYKLNLNCPGDR